MILIILILLYIATKKIIFRVIVHGISMEPLLQNGSQLVAVRRLSFQKPKRKSIVIICGNKIKLNDNKYYIKQITGVPGDYLDKSNCKIKENYYYVMSYNTNQMFEDSRKWGSIPIDSIIAIVFRP